MDENCSNSPLRGHDGCCALPRSAASAAVAARLRVRAGPVPTAAEQQRIHPTVEPGAWSREERTERPTEDGRSGIVRSGPDRVHHRPDHLRQTAADHPQSAILGESGFLRYWCLCVCGGGGGGTSARDPWRVLTANLDPGNPPITDRRGEWRETRD